MLKIAIFIVTYNNDTILNRCLESIFINHELPDVQLVVNIINNFKSVTLAEKFVDRVKIFNNETRPETSTGHLARNWNEAIMHGFGSINNPINDILILAQNDVVFAPNYLTNIVKYMQTYDFIACGHGDEVQLIKPEAIKQIGMYDERFCNIGYQEADYFLRAVLLYPQKVSINDEYHGRTWNTLEKVFGDIIIDVIVGGARGDEFHMKSMSHHIISRNVFYHKWGHSHECNWTQWTFMIQEVPKQYMYYPYFERDLPSQHLKYFAY